MCGARPRSSKARPATEVAKDRQPFNASIVALENSFLQDNAERNKLIYKARRIKPMVALGATMGFIVETLPKNPILRR